MRTLRRGLAAAAALLCLGGTAPAETAGNFDYYVLSLSWSPSYCETARNDRDQCSRKLGFVVHGLWPQFERGFPLACDTRETPPTFGEINGALDLFPTSGLARHEWREHGTCSGLSAKNYFNQVREARGRVNVPAFISVQRNVTVAPFAVETAFVSANPGLPRNAISVSCDSGRLTEVRVCLNKDLSFRGCPEVDSRACRTPQIRMPPMR